MGEKQNQLRRANHMKRYYGIDSDYLAKAKDLSPYTYNNLMRKGINGEDIAAIIGEDKYISPKVVYEYKLGERNHIQDNEKVYWHGVMDNLIINEFKVRNPHLKVQKINIILKHREHPWALGDSNKLVINEQGERGILETKNIPYTSWEESIGGTIPNNHMVKLQWNIFVSETKYAYFAAVIGGNRYLETYVERDEEIIDMLLKRGEEFWKNNVLSKAPPMDNTLSTMTLTKDSSKEKEIILPPETLDIINKRDELKFQAKEIDNQICKYDEKIKGLLQGNEIGICGTRKVTWKTYMKADLDKKSLKVDCPDIYHKYIKNITYRKFVIS